MFFLGRIHDLNRLTQEIRTMSNALDAVAAKITNLEKKVDAAVIAQGEAIGELKGLRSDLATALASNDTAALTALGDRLDAVTSKLDASSTALAAAEVPAAPAPLPGGTPVDPSAVPAPPADPTVPPTSTP